MWASSADACGRVGWGGGGGAIHRGKEIGAAEDDAFGFGSMNFEGCGEAYACEEHLSRGEYAKVTVRSSQLVHTSRKKGK